jgi:hypothetical protein
VPGEGLFEIKIRKDPKDRKGDHFLYDFELRRCEVAMTDAIGGNLQAVFEKGDAPARENDEPQSLRLVPEMAIPSEGHEHVRKHEQSNGCELRLHRVMESL